MRALFAVALTLSLAACGQPEAPPPLPEALAASAPPTWFICDALNAPVLLRFESANGVATVTQYEKPSGATVQTTAYTIGDQEGAAGSVITALLQNGAEAGAVRMTNSGMLETPASAYTPRYSSVRIGERELSCRWMPRTRLMGFTGRRTIVVSDDIDGDLLYHSYDFASAAEAQRIDLSENGETTTFSLEARDGAETTDANGARYTFQADTETQIVVTAPRTGAASIEVRRHGPEPVQTEELIAYIQGGAGAE
jgi:hypothetical protein